MYHTKHTPLTSTHSTTAVTHMGTAATKKSIIKHITTHAVPSLERLEELPVSVEPAHWVDMLPQEAIRGRLRKSTVHLCNRAEVPRRKVTENLQQDLLREVSEGGGAGLGGASLVEIGGGVLLRRHGVALSTCEVGGRREGGRKGEGGYCGHHTIMDESDGSVSVDHVH